MPNEVLAARFLRESVGSAIHIVVIAPDKQPLPYGRSFGDDAAAAAKWAMAENRKGYGVYWTVNIVRAGLDKKPKKGDIEGARFLHVDIDPPKDGRPFDRVAVLATLTTMREPPSFVTDSGGGIQAFWRLDGISQNLPAVEELNKRLAVLLGGDHCHNIDRLMRLPGTVNYPDEVKRSRGRITAFASILVEDQGEVVEAHAMHAILPPLPEASASSSDRPDIDLSDVVVIALDALAPKAPKRLRDMITMVDPGERSESVMRVASYMVRRGYSDDVIAGILLNPALAISGHCLDAGPGAVRAAQRAIGKAREGAKGRNPAPGGDSSEERVDIYVRDGQLHHTATLGEEALITAGTPFYVRSGIVRPILDTIPSFGGGSTRIARLKVVDGDTMVDYLSRCASWHKFSERAKGFVPTDPPRPIAMTILSRDGGWLFKSLAGIITTPTLRPDGTILSEAGYDSVTKLLLMDPPEVPNIPDQPTRLDALEALKKLDGLLDGFPFINEASRSVALSALITPVVRGALPVVPLVATTAPSPGSGKSFIIDVACCLATGDAAPVLSAGKNEEEMEKRLTAALLTAQPIITIDNVNGELAGDFLCQAIERPLVAVRPLGFTDLVRIENRACLFATGNNIHIVGDMTRCVILCSLDANMERPETRVFATDPMEMIKQDRGAYVAAALTIARAYAVAGYPDQLQPLASFKDWSRVVRSALVWLGCVDPLGTMNKARADDPVQLAFGALIRAWYDAVGSQSLTSGAIKRAAEQRNGFDDVIHPDFLAALSEVASGRLDAVDAKVLGKYLGRQVGRVVDGLKLVAADDSHSKQKVWKVTRI